MINVIKSILNHFYKNFIIRENFLKKLEKTLKIKLFQE